MKKWFLILFVGFLSVGVAHSQEYMGYFNYGGSFGLSGGNDDVEISIYPEISYQASPWFEYGISPEYSYRSHKDYTYRTIGWGAYSRGYYKSFYGYFALGYVWMKEKSLGEVYKANAPSVWVGGGYRQYLGERTFTMVGLKYNLLYDENDGIYDSPLMPTVGICIGF